MDQAFLGGDRQVSTLQRTGDPATSLSAQYVVGPLAKYANKDAWQIDWSQPGDSDRDKLTALLGGSAAPAFLLTAGHGMGYPATDSRQRDFAGSLLCQDWPGPSYGGSILDFYFAGEDLSSDTSVAGMIAMIFASYGADTPRNNDFHLMDGLAQANQIAPDPFLGRLPQFARSSERRRAGGHRPYRSRLGPFLSGRQHGPGAKHVPERA